MSDGIHFSLSNLPEKYRVQVAQKLAVERGGVVACPNEPKGVKGGFRASGDASARRVGSCERKDGSVARKYGKKRLVSPVRMTKNGDGPNQTEAQFNRDVLLGHGKYEAMTLHLPGGVKYTPDFIFNDEGDIYLVETKGSYHLPTHGRSVMAFKIACTEFPMFTFLFAELGKDGRTWTIGRYKDGKEIGTVRGTAKELHEME